MNNQNQKIGILQKLELASPVQIANLPEVADRFKKLYLTFHGKNGERYYEAEKFHFAKLIQESPKLQQCTKLSLYGCFLDAAVQGLSFDPSMKHCYIVPFNFNVGSKQSPKWESRASLLISGYGELHLRMQQGQIKYADNPILVYEGDHFEYGTENNQVVVTHKAVFPRKSENIIACYVKIVRNDDTVDYKVLSMDEVRKIQKFSKDPSSKAWTDGLPGMIQTKTIKHSFKSYPKLRLLEKAKFTQLATETIDEEAEVLEQQDIYGIEETAPVSQQQNEQNDFAEQPPAMNGNDSSVTVEDETF